VQPQFGGGGQDRDRPGRPTGDVAHTVPEAARVITRTLTLTCADCTNDGGGSGGRSADVPDHHLSGAGQCRTIAQDGSLPGSTL
jgi:hypothetical protein